MIKNTKIEVGQKFLVLKNWFTYSEFFNQFLKLEPNKIYIVTEVSHEELPDTSLVWGIVSFVDEDDNEYSIKHHERLKEYWCVFTETVKNEIRFIE